MNVLVWLHRDLRLHDHPALMAAAEAGVVLPLFVIDPADWAGPSASARQWEFLAEMLAFQREAFAAAGAPLSLRLGDGAEILSRLCRRHAIARVYSISDPGPRLRAAAGVDWVVTGEGPAPAPQMRGVDGAEPGQIPPARALRLDLDRCPNRQIGGDPGPLLELARAQLSASRSVAGMERTASRLSPFLSWGSLSPADITGSARLRRGGKARDQALTAAGPLLPNDQALHPGWVQGQTGLPFADACLRYLAAGGWLPADLRAMLVSVGVHHLGACPVRVGQALARMSTDHHPMLLAHGVAAALTRPVDPVALGRRLDADGSFTRRWLPELAGVPDTLVQTPWRWQGARHLLGRRYPEPLVDPANALRNFTAHPAPRRGPAPPRRPRRDPGQLSLVL